MLCTSAPAGPLTGYIAALLASLPAGWTLAASLLGWVNTIVRAKRWERRWGNPIRAADEPNPFYGLNLSNETAIAPPAPSDPDFGSASIQAHGPGSEGPPKVPPRAMVRGRGVTEIYHPQAGPQHHHPSHPTPPDTLRIAQSLAQADSSTNSKAKQTAQKLAGQPSDRISPRAMARGRGASHIYKKQPVAAAKDSSVSEDIEMQPMTPSPRARVQFVPPASLRHHQTYPDVTTGAQPAGTTQSPMARLFSTAQGLQADSKTAATMSSFSSGLWTWEASGRIKLMDSGLSNNLPSHVLMHPGRNVDVIIAFDASSDVQKGAAVQRIHEFGRDRGLRFRLRSEAEQQPAESADNLSTSHTAATHGVSPQSSRIGVNSARPASDRTRGHSPEASPRRKPRSEGSRTFVDASGPSAATKVEESKEPDLAEEIRVKFQDKYAQILDGWRVRPAYDPTTAASLGGDWVDVEEEEAMFAREPDVRMIYCPLLPSARVPDFDPSTSAFSTSYNLVWTPDQVETLIQCTKHNAEDYAIETIRQVVREVYESKKRRRLAEAAGFSL
ncbi:hypothetical protein OC834_002849 [Tilletia horrida]|nr:hypothetical protein OC834_002849 [Tilletia horrida]